MTWEADPIRAVIHTCSGIQIEVLNRAGMARPGKEKLLTGGVKPRYGAPSGWIARGDLEGAKRPRWVVTGKN